MGHWTDAHIEKVEEEWHGFPYYWIGYDETGQIHVMSSNKEDVVQSLEAHAAYLSEFLSLSISE
jgi:hypothetical protein